MMLIKTIIILLFVFNNAILPIILYHLSKGRLSNNAQIDFKIDFKIDFDGKTALPSYLPAPPSTPP